MHKLAAATQSGSLGVCKSTIVGAPGTEVMKLYLQGLGTSCLMALGDPLQSSLILGWPLLRNNLRDISLRVSLGEKPETRRLSGEIDTNEGGFHR